MRHRVSPCGSYVWHRAVVPVLLALVYVALCFLVQDPTYFPLQGILSDPDGYVRLIQVRDWLEGAGWYDTTVRATIVPYATNWTRLPDVLIGGLAIPFIGAVGMEQALFIAAFLAPLVLLAAWLVIVQGLVRELVPGRHPWAAMIAGMCAVSALVVAFVPGKVDHHAYGLLGYAATLWTLAYGVRRGFEARGRWLILGGLFTGLMVGATVEFFMGLGVFVGALVGFGVWRNERGVLRALTLWAVGLTGGVVLGVLLTRSPGAFFDVFYDRVSVAYVAASLGGLVLCLLGQHVFSRWGLKARILSVGLSAGTVAAGLMVTFPGLLDPQWDGYDSRAKDYVFTYVSEAQPLINSGLISTWSVVTLCPFVGVALGLSLGLTYRRRARPIAGWWGALSLAGIVYVALVLFFQNRVITYLSLVMIFPSAMLLAVGWRWFRRQNGMREVVTRFVLLGALVPGLVLLVPATIGDSPLRTGVLLFPDLGAAQHASEARTCDPRTMARYLRDPQRFLGFPAERIAVEGSVAPAIAFLAPPKMLGLGVYTSNPHIMDLVTLFTTPHEDEVRALVETYHLDAILLCRWTPTLRVNISSNVSASAEGFFYTLLHTTTPPSWLKQHEPELAPNWVVFAVERPEAAR